MDNETCQVSSDACTNGCSPVTVQLPTVDDSNDVTVDKATKKSRRKASKGKNDDNWRYCIQNCLHSGKPTNELIQCHMCQSWIHPECVGEDGKDIVGIWTCTSCRQLPVLVSRLLDKTSALELLVEKLAHSNQHLVNIAEQQCEEIRKLRDVVANASQRPSAVTNSTDAKSKPTTLLVGDSRLRDVHLEENASGNPIRTRVKSGARFIDIGEMIDDAAKTSDIGEIIIAGGAREMKEGVDDDLINDEVGKLLQKAKSVTQCVKISSILPSKITANSERLSDLNTKVRSTCVDNDVVFVDNDVNFTFRNGAVDDAAFQRDGIHLSESGTDRLLRNLDLPKQPVRRKQRLPQHRQVAMTSSARHSQANNAGTSPASPDNAWRVVSRQNRQRHTMGKCAKCGEKNHVTSVCKHVSKVRCRQCGELGHKEKHHTCD